METNFPPPAPSPFSAGEPKNNSLAVVSLGLGIAGFPFLCLSVIFGICACVTGLTGIAALATGFMARQQIQTSGEKGNGIALAGMIIGGLQIVLIMCGVCFFILVALVPAIGDIFAGIISGLK